MSIKKFTDLNIEKIKILEENEEIPIRIRKKGKYFEARLTININGISERKSCSSTLLDKAYNNARKVRNDYENGITITKNNSILLEEIAIQWFNKRIEEANSGKISKKTLVGYRYSIKKYIIPKLGNIRVKKLNSNTLQDFIDNIEKLAPKTIHEIYLALKLILDYAINLRIVATNVAIGIKLPELVKADIEFLQHNDYIKFESSCLKKGEIGESLLTILYSGIRAEELCGLRYCDLDFKNNILKVRHAFQENNIYNDKMEIIGKVRELTSLKTKTSVRDIPMTEKLKEILSNKRDRDIKKYKKNFSEDMHVFRNKQDEPLITNNLRLRLGRFIQQFNLNHITLHGLRHTFATYCVEAGMKPEVLKVILGHTNYQTTLKFYVHNTELNKSKSINLVENYIQDITNTMINNNQNNNMNNDILQVSGEEFEKIVQKRVNDVLADMLKQSIQK